MAYRLGVDVGGTFTDLALIDEASGRTFRAKTPSTPSDQSEGVMAGIRKVCALAGIEASEIRELMHGTTVATNAILEGKGAMVGLVTTEGYRQVLQIGRSLVPGGLAGWIVWPKPTPLALLENTVEVKERIGARGDVVRPLDEASARAALQTLKARAVQAVTVSFINAFANPAHERRIRELAAEILPGVPLSLSSDILPEMREYERALTTVANSYVRPTVAKYLANLEQKLEGEQVSAKLRVLRSDGGLMAFSVAEEAPVNLLMSGPAGGVTGALWVCLQAGFRNLLTFDMGGTSTDVALIENGEPRIRRDTRVGSVTVRASSLDVRTVGAGGGSIAKVPELTKALRVGPESAGAAPGPAAYGQGGTQPTVTDANVVLGYLPTALLGGEMKLDKKAAEAAIGTVAEALGIGLKEAAAGIVDIVNENMLGALRLVSIEQGYDPREFALVAFGGAGPLHANALGKLTGAWPVIIPASPGILCAYGDVTTRVRNEASRTFIRRVGETSAGQVEAILRELAEIAADALTREGVAASEQVVRYEIDLRYHGQGFEVPIPITIDDVASNGLANAGSSFDQIHQRMFTFSLDVPHEIVNLRAIVMGKPANVLADTVEAGDEHAAHAAYDSTSIYVDGADHPAIIYDRAKLKAGNRIVGPAILTQMDTTTLILPGHAGTVDEYGNVLIRPVTHRSGEQR
ncbi:MAG TPA: hydantoinase/oxoprolinase family protein [Alphaproteobacteria bacterium]|nr:hydantoinase/oxoprolinase family protein [Alphaproteobacteria bacterium]